jgi:uncharacterized protein YneF (UPF0154 family)
MDPNQKLTGIASMMPQGGAPMGPPPMGGGQPPMPPMGGGEPPMAPPMPEPGMGEMAMEGQPMPEEQGMNLEQDSAMLAEAVVGRAQGDIGAAIAVLDNAKAMLIASVEGAGQEPQMMKGGGALKPIPAGNKGLSKLPEGVRNNMGFMNMGGPLYAAEGMAMGDTDILRQMIMENLQKPAVQEQAMKNVVGQMGRGVSDRDKAMADLMKFKMS